MICRLPAAHRHASFGHARQALFCGVAATSAPWTSSHCRSHSTEEKPLSARKASWPSEATRNSPMGRSSQFAGANPKAVTTPFGGYREGHLEAVDPLSLGDASTKGGLSGKQTIATRPNTYYSRNEGGIHHVVGLLRFGECLGQGALQRPEFGLLGAGEWILCHHSSTKKYRETSKDSRSTRHRLR